MGHESVLERSSGQISDLGAELKPFFSIISVAYKDAWSLTKTARSVSRQSFQDFEYIVIDGDSGDGTEGLIEFWRRVGLVDKAICEPDGGVYEAMNKGIRQASGDFVCFMNAGDVFADDTVLQRVHELLAETDLDGCLGWGELNGQIWASWTESEAFKMSSLGFCHQSLYVRRPLLAKAPFDDRPHKTDSDTLQLGRLYENGADIAIVPEVLAIRGGEPGISANLERTKVSIIDTLVHEYPEITEKDAEAILAFRRRGEESDRILELLSELEPKARSHLARMVLDTLFQPASRELEAAELRQLWDNAANVVANEENSRAIGDVDNLLHAQSVRAQLLANRSAKKHKLQAEIAEFDQHEATRLGRLNLENRLDSHAQGNEYVVALTSFPARIKTLHYVIRSLLSQTRPPEEIHLFLGRDEIPNRNWLPGDLLALEAHGLIVNFVDRTFHQYDKFLHSASLNSGRAYVIVDDDVIYTPTSMEELLNGHQRYPDAVIANRCHLMQVDSSGYPAPYDHWVRESRFDHPSFRLMPTGAGGVLYPKGFLTNPYVCDVGLILSHAPYADDIWLKTCALLNGVPTFATPLSKGSEWYHRYTPTMRSGTLMSSNVGRGLNDVQIQLCCDWLDRMRPDWRKLLTAETEVEVLV